MDVDVDGGYGADVTQVQTETNVFVDSPAKRADQVFLFLFFCFFFQSESV